MLAWLYNGDNDGLWTRDTFMASRDSPPHHPLACNLLALIGSNDHMQDSTPYHNPQIVLNKDKYDCETFQSGVMWAAIVAGALVITVVSLLLFVLACALGFASLSPWGNNSAEMGKAFVISGAITLIVIQWVSAGLGGYLTGRLRTKFTGAHTHEVFFRDTVHGFLSWTLATLLGVLTLAAVDTHLHTPQAGFGRQGYNQAPVMYYVDHLFAAPQHDVTLSERDRTQAADILEMEGMNSNISVEDQSFLNQLVASRTGLSSADAERRVESVLIQEKATIDGMRKYAALASLFLFFSMIIGAFIASASGALGGQHRDLHYSTGRLTE